MPKRSIVVALVAVLAAGWLLAAEPPAQDTPLDEHIRALIVQLADRKFANREQATEALRRIGTAAIPALRAATDSEDPEVSFRARRALDTIEIGAGQNVSQPIIEIVRNFQAVPAVQRGLAIQRVARELGINSAPFLCARINEGVRGEADMAVTSLVALDADKVRPIIKAMFKNPANAYAARVAAWAAPVPPATPIPHAPKGLKVDGKLDDWKGVAPLPVPLTKKKAGAVRMAWSPDGLFFAIVTADKDIQQRNNEPWLADCVEIFLDKTFGRALVRDLTDAQYAFVPGVAGNAPLALIAFGANRRLAANMVCATTMTEAGYVMEILIPAAAVLPGKLAAGQKMGLNYAISDNGKVGEQFFTDKDTNSGWESAILWGPIVLQAPPEAKPAVDPLAPQSEPNPAPEKPADPTQP
jgi:cellulose/xylan binding protein with CBM9 domain